MSETYILAIDQGTTGSRALLFDASGRPVIQSYREFRQHYPQPGWVEHDPGDIWESTLTCVQDVMAKRPAGSQVAAIGITNQRETTLVWDRKTGEPIHNAIVWQCRRTADYCQRLREDGAEADIHERTGLVVDAYFSGTKLQWLLDHVEGARARAQRGELLFGTVDSWLVWNLTGGAVHVTDVSNASRTLLLNIRTGQWDPSLLEGFGVPEQMMPRVVASSEVVGRTRDLGALPAGIPIAGIAGDQQAALFGQTCFEPGMVKNTYGTGCFVMMHTGDEPRFSDSGLLTTVAWGRNGNLEYALEGSIFVTGAVIQWLRDELKLIDSAAQSEGLAQSVEDTGGVYLVPAFTGLGAPYWDMQARGTIVGMTRGTSRAHVCRAALESIAYQTKDVVDLMVEEAGLDLQVLRADGGATANGFLMQFQADLLNRPVQRAAVQETTALGAAYLAGLATGVWDDLSTLKKHWQADRTFEPDGASGKWDELYHHWRRAVKRSQGWIE